MLPTFPFSEVKSVARWTNFHGTIPGRQVPIYVTPDALGTAGGSGTPRRLARHGAALSAVADYCFSQVPFVPLRVLGARWSLSNVLTPGRLLLDPANLDVMLKIRGEWLEPEYRGGRGASGKVPIFTQGGATIASMNRRLAEIGLALQTTGAADGHRLAGCIATGTHGSAMGVGAVHDRVLALHLITGPKTAIFLQPESGAACTDDVAGWLGTETGIPTTSVRDDAMFRAALVSLGSLGIVHGVVIEAEPLYRLHRRQLALKIGDPRLWLAIASHDSRPLHPDLPERPFHFEVVMHPYPSAGRPAGFVTCFFKRPVDGAPPTSPSPPVTDTSSDVMGFLGDLMHFIAGPIATFALKIILSDQLEHRYPVGDGPTRLPGEVFGPSSLAAGHGTSTEIAVAAANAQRAVKAIYDALGHESDAGRNLLGALAIRFCPPSSAHLAMNIHPMTCFIEMPSIRSPDVASVYARCWAELESAGVPFTCHWGQVHGLTPARVSRYFGDRVSRWKAARALILPDELARDVFATPILADAGLSD